MNDVCSKTERRRGKTLVCALPLGHPGVCDDLLGNTWTPEPPVYDGELIL